MLDLRGDIIVKVDPSKGEVYLNNGEIVDSNTYDWYTELTNRRRIAFWKAQGKMMGSVS